MNKKIIFSEKEIIEIINLYTNQKLSQFKIAIRFNCSKSVIYKLLKKNNIPSMKRQMKFISDLSLEDKEQIILKYQNGITCENLGNEFDCYPKFIAAYLRESGITVISNNTNKQITLEDLQKEKFGLLTVLEEVELSKDFGRQFLCKCECGKLVKVLYRRLKNRSTKSCGNKAMHYTGTNSAHFNGFKTISGTIMHQIRVNALERKIHFDISAEYLHNLFEKQEGKCALSGMSIQLYTTRKDKKNATASLDRINSSIGYIEGNVQWVHKHMNFMKLDFTQEQFINYCRLVVKHFS